MDSDTAQDLLNEYFGHSINSGSLHSYYTCKQAGCCSLKHNTKGKDKFQHNWLFDQSLAYCHGTGMWWLIFVDDARAAVGGMYCLLCRIHNTKNKYNKDAKFNTEPSVRYKKGAIFNPNAKEGDKKDLGHSQSGSHLATVNLELSRRQDTMAKEYKQMTETVDKVTFNAMMSCYWLAKEEISNVKLPSLLHLQEQAGLSEMHFWKHRSQRSQREQRLLIGQLLKQQLLERVRDARWYSILVDEVTDCAVIEQLLIYIGYVGSNGEPMIEFLDVQNCLKDSDSPDAATITRLILEELNDDGLSSSYLCGFGSDGASVMTGSKSGVGVRLQQTSPIMLRSHCISHRLALACGDANDSVKYILEVERILIQLWKWLEYPKRSAAYVKIARSIQALDLTDKQTKTLATKVQKACRTRWLSTGKSI